MTTDFLHGVEVVSVDAGPRPIQTVRSAVIGLIGTAPDADVDKFPLNTPVLVNSRGGMAGLGAEGTIPEALTGIFDQFGAFVVVIRVTEGASANTTMGNIVGGVDPSSGVFTGVHAFRASEGALGLSPMLLIAPGFTSQRPTGVTAVVVGTPGSAYTTPPTVAFTGGGTETDKVLPTGVAVLGTGANAGKVVSVTITNPGYALTAAPTIAFTGGGGSAAAATATIAAYANPVVTAMLGIANQLRAHVIAEGPNTTDAAALTYRADFGSRRVYIADPAVKVWDATLMTPAFTDRPNSPRVAGLIARVDHEVGFWKSPSNEIVNNIGGLGRPVDYALGDANTRANLLNENGIATFIRDDGFRLWGNRTASDDQKWAFLSVSRTADMVDRSIMVAHKWALDKPITRQYYDDVTASVNGYLRQLQSKGAILGGKCWVDPDFNTPEDIAAGKATFSYDFTPPTPAERITFRSTVTSDYIPSIFAQ